MLYSYQTIRTLLRKISRFPRGSLKTYSPGKQRLISVLPLFSFQKILWKMLYRGFGSSIYILCHIELLYYRHFGMSSMKMGNFGQISAKIREQSKHPVRTGIRLIIIRKSQNNPDTRSVPASNPAAAPSLRRACGPSPPESQESPPDESCRCRHAAASP